MSYDNINLLSVVDNVDTRTAFRLDQINNEQVKYVLSILVHYRRLVLTVPDKSFATVVRVTLIFVRPFIELFEIADKGDDRSAK